MKNILEINKRKIIIIIGIILTSCIILTIYLKSDRDEEYDYIQENEEIQISIESDSEILNDNNEMNSIEEIFNEPKKNKIIIHIVGEVNNPGIIYLEEGDRIANAIEAAGGITKDADLNQINLAYALKDGQKIYIPNKNEKLEKTEYIISNSGQNVLIDEGNVQKSEINKKGVDKKVNINLANVEELENLPGIGTSLAQRIVDYRESNGKFMKIEDIQNVKGIGESKYSNIKERICIE